MNGINFFKDKAKFDALNSKVLKYLKAEEAKTLNSKGLKAVRWCNPIIHPKTKDLVFTVKDRILPAVTSAEKKEIFELKSDWFPKPEII